ncbi:MAG: AMP-binding protein [Chloroflexi bacterium]|nr:AMP-binding protein [Chloroflexota bacterium]
MERRYFNRQIETGSREALLAYQWKLLKEQLEYTYTHSGLCQRQFRAARITPDDIKSLADFTNKVPFTTKKDLLADQQEQPPYGTRLAIPENEIRITYLTSGTSGRGQEVHAGTMQDWENYFEGLYMMYTWVGWKPGDRVMQPLPYSTAAGGFGHTLGMLRYGLNAFNLGMYDTKTKLDYMRRFQINGIFISASYLENVTAEIEKMGQDPARDYAVKTILMAGQAYPLSFVHRMEAKWQAKIFDYYGSTQLALGATCENGADWSGRRGYYHMLEHQALHEVINPETLQPVAPGEEGEVVVTPFRKRGSPYLRFRQGDKAKFFPYGSCDCGRPFNMLEAGTVARYDDMMKIKGMNIWPEAVEDIILSRDEAAEYKGRVFMTPDGKEVVEVAIEFRPGVAPEMKKRVIGRIENDLRDRTGIGFAIKEADGELPRYVFKATSLRWTDERVKGLDRKRMDKG